MDQKSNQTDDLLRHTLSQLQWAEPRPMTEIVWSRIKEKEVARVRFRAQWRIRVYIGVGVVGGVGFLVALFMTLSYFYPNWLNAMVFSSLSDALALIINSLFTLSAFLMMLLLLSLWLLDVLISRFFSRPPTDH